MTASRLCTLPHRLVETNCNKMRVRCRHGAEEPSHSESHLAYLPFDWRSLCRPSDADAVFVQVLCSLVSMHASLFLDPVSASHLASFGEPPLRDG
jgi:hypothetical protein